MWIRMWLRLCSREASCPPHPFPSCSHEPCPELGCDCRCVCTSLPWSRRRWIRGQCPSSTTLRCYYPAGGPAERRCEVRAAQVEAPGMTEAAGGNGCSPLEMLRRWVRRVSLTPLWHPAVRMTAVQHAKCVCGREDAALRSLAHWRDSQRDTRQGCGERRCYLNPMSHQSACTAVRPPLAAGGGCSSTLRCEYD